MTGSPGLGNGDSSTGAKHPSILREGAEKRASTDKLRRMAIRNSYRSGKGTVIGTATGGSKAQSPAQSLRSHSSSDCHKLQRAFSASRTSLLETDHHPAPRSAPMWRSSSYSCLSARSVAGSPAPTSIRPPRRSLHPSSSDRVAPTPPLAPCSTTTLDFHRHPNQSPRAPRTWRCGTPRGNNPHPVGLVFQSPYNQHNKAFEIWNPDIGLIESRFPQMFRHIDTTNFTCGKIKPYAPGRGNQPGIHYSTASAYRQYYQSPQASRGYDTMMPTTRFGSSPPHCRYPTVGIVPNVMSPRGVAMGKRIKLHPPRGKKVESLV